MDFKTFNSKLEKYALIVAIVASCGIAYAYFTMTTADELIDQTITVLKNKKYKLGNVNASFSELEGMYIGLVYDQVVYGDHDVDFNVYPITSTEDLDELQQIVEDPVVVENLIFGTPSEELQTHILGFIIAKSELEVSKKFKDRKLTYVVK
ncbi:MAG: hypothetical protein HUJ97_04850 [Bacteroidales bacterium]|nr:hypothetical protein [Bacteroidales bacterium]